ncbi:sugar transferase [Devosia sp. XJ19-1]|uniref:Sugar transferase n=1 Tax=Devosia ureilytica TaxID=2952754 RepID=A0A9Q4AM89_9HYPH|nr:sugar transferase [Devosia ureilytica]MCP8881903.1 sugar transferase [Devosia ureilytica]MCP8886211.1 sugar transferase [Devosia ureilytica]
MSELLDFGGGESQIGSAGFPNSTGRATDCAEPGWSSVSWHSGLSLYWGEGRPASIGAFHGHRRAIAVKRVFDVAGSFGALALLLPLLLVVAALIKFSSPGPVFFVQQREGLGGKLFGILKFRTMESQICDPSGLSHTLPGDRRVTAFGRFLRRTSIDELPQLLNVLRGEMSLVGPRPHVPGMLALGRPFDEIVPYYRLRYAVLPGITGWAQANGLRGCIRNGRAATARVDHDLAYIQNWSLWLDCRILVLTLWREIVTGTGE